VEALPRLGHNHDVSDDLADLLALADMVEVGRRIRRARVTKGLTQAQLAGADVSVGYVSRIEAGKRRPDPAVFERLAERLHTAPLVLLNGGSDPEIAALQVAVDHAELSLRGGAPAEAKEQLDAIWDEVIDCGAPDLEHRARLTHALASEALGRLDDAIVELEDLLAAESQEAVRSLRPAMALSRCYREGGDLARAIEIGERHLELLSRLELEGSDEAVQLVVTVAAAYFERGDVAHAARMCRRAVERAERLGSPMARASAYWNASIIESERGSVDAAVLLAEKALRLMESVDDNRNLAMLRTQLGRLQLRLDPPQIDAARANLVAAEPQLRWSSASPVDQGWNAVLLARADLVSEDLQAASDRATAVLDRFRDVAPLLTAEALMILGQVAARGSDAPEAARHYREAVIQLSAIGSDRGAAEAWFELGALLDDLDLEGEARDAYRRAAASTGLRSVYSVRRDGLLRG
jgi:transcriptional regulator with XRE-family HTH domain